MTALTDRFVADLAGQIAGLDDPSVLEAFLADRDPSQVVFDVITQQGPNFEAALEAFMEPHAATLIVSSAHPCLEEITSWVLAQGETVLLLASPAGPPPNAVLVLEHDR